MFAEEMLARAAERIAASASDAVALSAIDAELAARTEPKARALRIKIASLQRELKLKPKSASIAVAGRTTAEPVRKIPSQPRTGIWGDLLCRNGLTQPDSRPLHRYRLTDEEHDAVRQWLQSRSDLANDQGRAGTAALFVLWSAHWFQRGYRGGMRRWEDLSAALGVAFSGQIGRQLVRDGLQAWARPPVKSEGDAASLWLRTLAVEGGFPAGVLDQANAWPELYLNRVVGALLGSDIDDDAAADSAAESQGHYAPRAYRQGIFFALAADLAQAVVRLRHRVATDPRAHGVPASAWLDATTPGWRGELPVRTGSDAADRLIDGLMKVEALRFAGNGEISCDRMLTRNASGMWRPGIRLGLDGMAKGHVLDILGRRHQRLRAYPTGALTRHIVGEIAVFEPPGEDGDTWRVHPSRGDPRVEGVPFSTPITVELRFERQKIGETPWPGGHAVLGDIHVFDPVAEGSGNALKLIGTTAGGYGLDRIIVAIPSTWSASPDGAADVVTELPDEVESGQRLWAVQGRVILRSPENDRYSIATGQRGAARDQLLVSASKPAGIASDDPAVELCAGALSLAVSEGSKVRTIRSEELRWRIAGERGGWRSAPHESGLIDIAWRDPKTGYLRDTRRVFVLPEGARLTFQPAGSAGVYRAEKFDLSDLASANPDMMAEIADGKLVARFLKRPSRLAHFMLADHRGRSLRVSTAFPQRAGFARWSGECIRGRGVDAPETPLTISDLADCVAYGRGREVLRVELFDRDGRRLNGGGASWEFTDELPMRGVAQELSALLAPFGDIDVRARLTFDGAAEFWQVQQFEASIHLQSGQLARIGDVQSEEALPLMGRSVSDLTSEIVLAESTHEERAGRRVPSLAHVPNGTWLVYLKRGDQVIARPSIVHLGSARTSISEGLAGAVAMASRTARETAISDCLSAIATGESSTEADTRWLVELASRLAGLPPASLDVFRLMPSSPTTAARLALHARDATERCAVMSLMEGLPFAWHLIGHADWRRAATTEEKSIFSRLETVLGPAKASELATQTVQAAAGNLVQLCPLLGWPLYVAGLCPPPSTPTQSLMEAARDHIRRYGDRIVDQAGGESLFRRTPKWSLPDEFSGNFHQVHLEMLDAPCAAACVASGEASADPEDIRRMKTAERVDPIYFAAAFNAQLVRLAQRPARP